MLPHISGVQAPFNQQIHGPAVHNSDLNHCNASAIVEKCIQKLSLELIKKSENSKALSPASLTPVLGMLLAAMDDNNDKEKILGLPKGALTPEFEAKVHHELGKYSKNHPYDENRMIATANFIASRYQCQNEGFKQILKEAYDTNVLAITDVKNVADITDEFVTQKTQGEITSVFDSMSPAEREELMFSMGNVLTFKGMWNSAFKEDLTKPGEFHCADGRTIKDIEMMRLTDEVQCGTYNEFEIMIKDFKPDTDPLQFVAIIPNEQSGQSIKNLDVDTIDTLICLAVNSQKSKLELTLPRMEIDSKTEDLELEIGSALNVSINSEKLSKVGIILDNQLNMIQKVKASINEKGAYGSVVTAFAVTRKINDNPAFKFNRPGYIAIADSKGSILVEAFVKDGEFLVSHGAAEYSQKNTTLVSRSIAEPLDRLTRLIGDQFNQNGDLKIISIEEGRIDIIIMLGKLEDATILSNKIKDDLGSEFKNYVKLWEHDSSVEISFKARDKLKAKLGID